MAGHLCSFDHAENIGPGSARWCSNGGPPLIWTDRLRPRPARCCSNGEPPLTWTGSDQGRHGAAAMAGHLCSFDHAENIGSFPGIHERHAPLLSETSGAYVPPSIPGRCANPRDLPFGVQQWLHTVRPPAIASAQPAQLCLQLFQTALMDDFPRLLPDQAMWR
eukprot:s202_g19.t1